MWIEKIVKTLIISLDLALQHSSAVQPYPMISSPRLSTTPFVGNAETHLPRQDEPEMISSSEGLRESQITYLTWHATFAGNRAGVAYGLRLLPPYYYTKSCQSRVRSGLLLLLSGH